MATTIAEPQSLIKTSLNGVPLASLGSCHRSGDTTGSNKANDSELVALFGRTIVPGLSRYRLQE